MTNLPDWQHIEDIRKRLWSNREFGQASVMIGAGFSRNAEKTHTNVPDFPLWSNIGDQMYRKLYSANIFESSDAANRHRTAMTSGSGLLRLASEYETTYGRLAVDDLLLESIPDNLYRPGTLHRLLLSLPWSDVFTTNYDSLLERTQPYLHERKYDVIRTFQEIPGRMKPRIVKLHGSFPAHRPFILTEDDFRNYPITFGAFVNIVQQSIMENAFCLIGFSGDDPNFLSWTGWVRDRLGDSCPPIYLCGIFNHSPSLKKLLENRNIKIIDLGPLVQNSHCPKDQMHSAAMEWFLHALHEGESPRSKWLDHEETSAWQPRFNLPLIPRSTVPVYPIERHAVGATTQEELANILNRFEFDRKQYPGWIVVPENHRSKLWLDTENILFRGLTALDKLLHGDDLKFVYELNWRLEKCLIPIEDRWIEKYVEVIEKYNPFPALISLPDALTPDAAAAQSLNWSELTVMWVDLSFSVIRKFREEFRHSECANWLNRIGSIRQFNGEWKDRWFYERCLSSVFSLDPEGLAECLTEWDSNSTDVLTWKHRRAALLAELGDVDNAKKLATEVLSEVRSRYQPYNVDVSLLSQEAWVMVLLNSLTSPLGKSQEEFQTFRNENRSRWQWLEAQGYDPWELIEKINVQNKLIEKSSPSGMTITEGFDPGVATTSLSFGQPSEFERVLAAYSALRLFEECGLPIEIPTGLATVTSSIKVDLASRNIYPLSPMWALSAMVRGDKKEELSAALTRSRVAILENAEIESLYSLFFNTVRIAETKLSERTSILFDGRTSFHRNCLSLGVEVLSRLAFRVSDQHIHDLLDFSLVLYEKPFLRSYPTLSKMLEPMWRRVFSVLPDDELLKNLDRLLRLPLPDEGGFGVGQHADLFVNPFDYISWKSLNRLPDGFDARVWKGSIDNLNRVVQFGSEEGRKQAVSRLLLILDILPTCEKELSDFYDALWSRLDPAGMPSETNLSLWGFLRFAPADKCEDVKSKIRNNLLSENFSTRRDFFDECVNVSLCDATVERERSRMIDWTPDEVKRILTNSIDKLREQLPKQENRVVQRSLGGKDIETFVRDFLGILAKIIMPRLDLDDVGSLAEISRIVEEIENQHYSTIPLSPALLRFFPERLHETGNNLRVNLNSFDENKALDAVIALYFWLLSHSFDRLPAPPSDLVSDLINKILFRRQPILDTALDFVSLFIRKRIVDLSGDSVRDLCHGLTFLLEDTKLTKGTDQDLPNVAISFEQRPKYRRLAARLSLVLKEYLVEEGREVPETLRKWQEIRRTDCLPEVRYAY